MLDLSELNEKQKEAVLCNKNHIIVIAGPGAGKTKVLTTRIANLIENEKVNPSNILAITFTNKAANEMKKRNGKFLGYPASFQILDTEDQETIIKEAINELNYDKKSFPVKPTLNTICNYKFQHISPEEAVAFAYGSKLELCKIEVYKYYCGI